MTHITTASAHVGHRAASMLLALLFTLALAPAMADAAKPVRGATYVGSVGGKEHIELPISREGRRIFDIFGRRSGRLRSGIGWTSQSRRVPNHSARCAVAGGRCGVERRVSSSGCSTSGEVAVIVVVGQLCVSVTFRCYARGGWRWAR